MTNLDALIAQLDELEAELPILVVAHPNEGEFWAAFAGQADLIEDEAGPHTEEVQARIDAMLARAGVGTS